MLPWCHPTLQHTSRHATSIACERLVTPGGNGLAGQLPGNGGDRFRFEAPDETFSRTALEWIRLRPTTAFTPTAALWGIRRWLLISVIAINRILTELYQQASFVSMATGLTGFRPTIDCALARQLSAEAMVRRRLGRAASWASYREPRQTMSGVSARRRAPNDPIAGSDAT